MTINELGKQIKTLKDYPLRTDVEVIVVDPETDSTIEDTTITFKIYGDNRSISVYLFQDGTWLCQPF